MADTFDKAKRSQIMAAVRSTRNKATEIKLLKILRDHRITGWRRNQKLFGKPDFVFLNSKLAVFVDGCFWHGCRKHLRIPTDNRTIGFAKFTAIRTGTGRRYARSALQDGAFCEFGSTNCDPPNA